MTLADLEAIALGNNPTLVQAAGQVEAARGRWVQVGLYPNPTIAYQGSEIGNEGQAGLQGGFVEQEIVTGGKLGLNRAVAGREVAQAQQRWEAQRFRVLTDVRTGYYSVLVAQRTLELSRQLLDIGERGLASANDLLEAKEASRVEVLQARVEANTAKVVLLNAENRHSGAWRRLASVLGIPEMEPTELSGDLQGDVDELTWNESLSHLLSASPEVASARAGIDRARLALSRARAELIPNLGVQAGAQYDASTQDTVANIQIGIPLFFHNRNQGNIREAQAHLRAAQAEVSRVELDLRNRLAVVFERYSNARQQVELYSGEILPDAQDSLDLVAIGYRQGEFNFLTLLTAQRTYFQANLAYINALSELWGSTVEIEGLLLSNSLQTDRL